MDHQFAKCPVSRSFKKPVALPNINEFAVHPEDVIVTGSVLSNVKSKGIFVNQISTTGERQMAVTKQGYLIIWMKSNEGFVLDVRGANSIMTVFKNTKKNGMVTHNCDLKMKFASGTVNLFLRNEKINKWRGVIGDLYDGVMVVSSNGQNQHVVTTDDDRINNSELEDTGDAKSVLDTTYTEAVPSNSKSDGPVSSGSNVSVQRSDSQLSGKNSTKSISTRSPVAVATPATPKTPVIPMAPFPECKTPVTPTVPKPKSTVKTPVLPRTPTFIIDYFPAPEISKKMEKSKPETPFCLDYTAPMALLSKIHEAVAEPVCKPPRGVFKDSVETTEFKKPNLFLTAPQPRKTTKVVPVVYRPQQSMDSDKEKEPRHSVRSGTLSVSTIRKLLETKSRTDIVNEMVQAEALKKADTPRPLKITSKQQKMSFVTSGRLPSLFGKAALDSPSSRRGTEPGRCESAPAAFNYDDILDEKTVDPRLISPEKKESEAEVKKDKKSVKFSGAPYDGWNDSVRM